MPSLPFDGRATATPYGYSPTASLPFDGRANSRLFHHSNSVPAVACGAASQAKKSPVGRKRTIGHKRKREVFVAPSSASVHQVASDGETPSYSGVFLGDSPSLCLPFQCEEKARALSKSQRDMVKALSSFAQSKLPPASTWKTAADNTLQVVQLLHGKDPIVPYLEKSAGCFDCQLPGNLRMRHEKINSDGSNGSFPFKFEVIAANRPLKYISKGFIVDITDSVEA